MLTQTDRTKSFGTDVCSVQIQKHLGSVPGGVSTLRDLRRLWRDIPFGYFCSSLQSLERADKIAIRYDMVRLLVRHEDCLRDKVWAAAQMLKVFTVPMIMDLLPNARSYNSIANILRLFKSQGSLSVLGKSNHYIIYKTVSDIRIVPISHEERQNRAAGSLWDMIYKPCKCDDEKVVALGCGSRWASRTLESWVALGFVKQRGKSYWRTTSAVL